MNLMGLSIFKSKNFAEYETQPYTDVQAFYYREGPGNTLTFWRLDDQIIYEDHQGGRPNFERNYDLPPILKAFDYEPVSNISEAFVLFHSDDNAGHSLSSILKAAYIYETANLTCTIVVPQDLYNLSPFIKSVIDFLFPNDRLYFSKSGELINYQLAYLYQGSWFYRYEFIKEVSYDADPNIPFNLSVSVDEVQVAPEVEYFQRRLAEHLIEEIPKFEKVVALIKFADSIQVTTHNRVFGESYKRLIESPHVLEIDPAGMSLIELYNKVYSASKIITSWGAISFINKLFFKPNCEVLFLCHKGYRGEYSDGTWQLRNCYVPRCRSASYLFDLPTEVDMGDPSAQLISEFLA